MSQRSSDGSEVHAALMAVQRELVELRKDLRNVVVALQSSSSRLADAAVQPAVAAGTASSFASSAGSSSRSLGSDGRHPLAKQDSVVMGSGAGGAGGASAAAGGDDDDAVAQALVVHRVRECVSSLQADNAADVLDAGASALQMMLSNVVRNPTVPRYRRFIVGNPLFSTKIAPLVGHERLLQLLGFEKRDDVWESKPSADKRKQVPYTSYSCVCVCVCVCICTDVCVCYLHCECFGG
jgi:hypothetical protein